MKNFLITLGTVLLIIAIVVGGGYLFVRQTINTHTYRPIEASATEEDAIIFEIESGMWPATVVGRLYEEGLIRHEWIANQVVRFNQWGAIQAGEYELHPGLSLYEMFALFTEGGGVYESFIHVIIPEGELITEIAHRVANALDMDADYLMEVWSDVDFLNELIDEYWFITDEILNSDIIHPLEGYFYPIRHEIPEDFEDAKEVTRVMLNMTQSRLSTMRQQMESHEMTFHELLTFASMVEGETQVQEDMSLVAGVFYNRFVTSYPFRSCVTVQYIAPERSFHVTAEMAAIESPYNTYMHAGLPPGPVNSPSSYAIMATLDPAEHHYFFFIGDIFNCVGGGTHFFETFEEHLEFSNAYLEPSYAAGESLCDPNAQLN